MGEFHRSPSKVWWAEESLSWRTLSESPGSQDSGFSDTETSPQLNAQLQDKVKTPEKQISDALVKTTPTLKNNLTSEIVEKSTPVKSIRLQGLISPGSAYFIPDTPLRKEEIARLRVVKTEPNNRRHLNKLQLDSNLHKVSRNLFNVTHPEHTNGQLGDNIGHQYAKEVSARDASNNSNNSSAVPAFDESEEFDECTSFHEEVSCNQTVPFVSRKHDNYPPNLSAPAYIQSSSDGHEAVTRFDQEDIPPNEAEHARVLDLDESESEMETYFQLKSPKHTSTPKLQQKQPVQRLGRIHAMNLLHKYQKKLPRLDLKTIDEKTSTDMWIKEQKHNFEPECVTTLQCKSIAAELANKVGQLATKSASTLRAILKLHLEIIDAFDYFKNNKEMRHESASRILPLIQEYLDVLHLNHDGNGKELNLKHLLETTKTVSNTMNLGKLHKVFLDLHKKCLNKAVENFLEQLADPRSEMDIRAKLTALTSLSLRCPDLVVLFVQQGAIQTITAIIEKCEGSSVRGLGLRALTTLCVNAESIRKLESVSGLCTISDIVCDHSRPEPERIEAIALLAQITAPWIDDNHNVQGLHTYSKRLVKYLTRHLEATTCCQNILLISAALSNLTAMDCKAIKYLLHHGTIELLLDIVKNHGNIASVYILEQIATLIATMAAVPEARIALCDIYAPVALLCFLQTRFQDTNVIVRLQQRAVIGISRLCSEKHACEQVVEAGGVDKLIQLCKEKKERYDNDAILVAALATLRKVTEVCGVEVMSDEDAQEFIQPKLLDSFKAYSTQNESLV